MTTSIFGNYQKFSYPAESPEIEVELDDPKFWKSNGDGFSLFGYDRYDDPSFSSNQQISLSGDSVWTGYDPLIPQLFFWNLQLLPQDKYLALWAMFKRQQREREPILFFDGRLVMEEVSPRKRAEFQPLANPPEIEGMTYFWAQFLIELSVEGRELWSSSPPLFELSLQGREVFPALPPSEDLP